MSKLQIYEILSKLKEFTGEGAVAKKVEWLKQHDSQTLRLILQHNFDPNIHYNLPEGDPPFKLNEKPIDYNETTLYSETRKLSYLWITPYDASLKVRVQAQEVELEKRNQIVSEHIKQQKTLAEEIQKIQKTYDNSLLQHNTHLTVLADLEAKITLAKKNVEASRVEMAQLKVRLNTLTEQQKNAQYQLTQMNQTLNHMNNIHMIDKKKLAQQPSAPPPIDPNPAVAHTPRHRLELSFIQLLEALHPNEAQVILGVKNKTLTKMFALNKDIVKKAFPDIIK